MAAREISRDPKVLIAAQPTRGLDVGAIEYLHRRLVEERDEGRAILLVSLELDEIRSLSDRILVIYEGELVGEHGEQASEEEIGMEMLGSQTGGRRVTRARASPQPPKPPEPDTPPTTVAGRLDLLHRAGGISVPLATGVLAFAIGGLVVLASGHNPFLAYRDILQGAEYDLARAPLGRRHRPHGAVQPLPDTPPDDDPDPDGARRGVRLPLRALQHRRPGPVLSCG